MEKKKIKLTEEVQTLILEHCKSIPHAESHYRRDQIKLNYFDDKSLTVHDVYNLFLKYYALKTGSTTIPLREKTYYDYFNHYVPFSVNLPRTDVCNLCYTYESTKLMADEYKIHKTNIDNYNNLKKSMMATNNVLHAEFDFAQNLPLPKLPVNAQFFLRLLWLYVFNVHIHSNKRSYMFYFLEGTFKKGSNSVCNMLRYAILKELQLEYYDKIFLYSDAAGGQNRNYLMLQYLSILSVELQLEIQHLFPVRGHSYCQCDRNFGLYGSKKKKHESIETPEEYVEIIKNSRCVPFEMVDITKCEMKDFEKVLVEDENLAKDSIKISKVVKCIYYPNGQVSLFYDYYGEPTTIYLKNLVDKDLSKAPLAPAVGITEEKIKDFSNLLKYCSPKGQALRNQLLSTAIVKTKVARKKKTKNHQS